MLALRIPLEDTKRGERESDFANNCIMPNLLSKVVIVS
jgi:hypothetical protein